ncbi:hypothetical protein [uncultured Thiodictyon sp.]|uniref:hypothetical protein n=1 Tax=uncultured Thiodictyon sp. TaxID=1846217 RepID=UPI0025E4B71D|nr:hypothetical protein [uncultured Thiodictyon sp.]
MDQQSESDTGIYPFSTLLAADPDAGDAGGYSILLAGLRHRVHLRQATPLPGLYRRQLRKLRLDWCRDFTDHGWNLHPYLNTPPGDALPGRCFAPAHALCPSAHEALFGKSFPRAGAPTTDADLVYRRLDARDQGCRHEEPLLLSLGTGAHWLGSELQVAVPDGDGPPETLGFRVEWADLWLFPDSHALHPLCNAVLACKLVPTRVTDLSGATRSYGVGDLALLNRLLRDLDHSERGGAWLNAAGGGPQEHFWGGVLRHWLGLTMDGPRVAAGPENVLRLESGDEVWADHRSHYVKVLTVARIAPPPADGGFSCPRVEPPLAPARMAREQAAGIWSPEQSACLQAQSLGYPGLGEALLYELASISREGSALGLNGDPSWQANLEYLRGQSGVAIWEHWRGLALRDTCAFLAWHPRMPILGQAESRYYPLYLCGPALQRRASAGHAAGGLDLSGGVSVGPQERPDPQVSGGLGYLVAGGRDWRTGGPGHRALFGARAARQPVAGAIGGLGEAAGMVGHRRARCGAPSTGDTVKTLGRYRCGGKDACVWERRHSVGQPPQAVRSFEVNPIGRCLRDDPTALRAVADRMSALPGAA